MATAIAKEVRRGSAVPATRHSHCWAFRDYKNPAKSPAEVLLFFFFITILHICTDTIIANC